MVGCREISGIVGAVIGAFCGSMIGGILGAALGYLLVSMLFALLFESYDAISQNTRRRRKWARLQHFFGEYYAPEKRDEWGAEIQGSPAASGTDSSPS